MILNASQKNKLVRMKRGNREICHFKLQVVPTVRERMCALWHWHRKQVRGKSWGSKLKFLHHKNVTQSQQAYRTFPIINPTPKVRRDLPQGSWLNKGRRSEYARKKVCFWCITLLLHHHFFLQRNKFLSAYLWRKWIFFPDLRAQNFVHTIAR